MKNFFTNMDSEDKVMAVLIMVIGAIVITYIIANAIAGKSV